MNYYEQLLGVNDNLQGRPSSIIGTRATARGQNQLLQQTGVRINMVARRLRRAWDEYVWQIHQLDMQYLPPGIEFRVTNEVGEPFYDTIRDRFEIKGKFDFRHRSVVEVKTPQVDRQEAQTLFQLLVGHPLIAQDVGAQGEILLDLVKAYKKDNLIKVIKRIMNAANQIPDVKDPQAEIGEMNQGIAVLPNPQEDLAGHLKVHLAYRVSQDYKNQPERIKILHDSHVMKTLFLFRQAKESGQGEGEEVPVEAGQNRVAEFAGFDTGAVG